MNNLFNVIINNNKSVKVVSQLKKKIQYINILLNKILLLNTEIELESFKSLYIKKELKNVTVKKRKKQLENFNVVKVPKKFLVVYIITISFLKANTTIHVSDTEGNVKLFYNSGSVNLTGKQKRRRITAVFRLLKLVFKNAFFLYKNPIALHLNNVTRHKHLIVKKLKQYFFIKVIREFNQVSYNGCRKPKVRRKKFKKKFR